MTDITVRVVEQPITIELAGGLGASLYDLWLADGNSGTLSDFIDAVIAGSGVTVTTASGSTVASRALMAAITTPANGQTAYLTESGREGWFKFSTADHSANVTADPYQGLYVPPSSDTDGSSGAWVRIVDGLDYQLSWWGGTTATADISVVMESAAPLLPAGATLHIGAGTFAQTTTANFFEDDFRLQGQGPEATHLVMAVGSGFIPNLGFAGSNVSVDGIGLTTNTDHVFANGNGNVGFGVPNGASAPLYENFRVTNCRFTGAGIGLIISGSDDNDATITLAKNILVDNCIFENDTMGLSLAACEDARVSNCLFKMLPSTPNGASCCIRVWGSKNVAISDCSGNGTGEYGFYITTMARTTATGFVRLQNENIYANNCHFTDCDKAGLHITECIGDFLMGNCSFRSDVAGTDNNNAIMLYAGFSAVAGVDPVIGNLELNDCKFIGYSVGIREQMLCRKVTLNNVEIIGNSNADVYPTGKACGYLIGGFSLFEIRHSSFLMATQSAGANFRVASGSAANRLRITYSTLPETAPSAVIDDVTGLMGEKVATPNLNYASGTFAQFIA